MEWMMERVGHPEKSINAIHIAGTNGKGSTLSFLRELLQAQGCTVGTFTSPYIVRFNERISMNGEPISDEHLSNLVERVKPVAEELAKTPLGEPTEFEVITAMSMMYFADQSPDFVLYETGLGGLYDSTNIIHPTVSIITNIGKDHMNILGDTYEQIASEKAGIIKKGVPVICGAKQPEAIQVIRDKADEEGAEMFLLGEQFHASHTTSSKAGETFQYDSKDDGTLSLISGMKGVHQVDNASLAVKTMDVLRRKGWSFDRDLYAEAIKETKWPARFETVLDDPVVIIDGAHNEEGTKALVETLKSHYEDKRITLVYSALEDKPVRRMLEILSEVVDCAYMTTFDFPRALSANQLKNLSPIEQTTGVEDYEQAIEQAVSQVDPDDLLLVTGSLYFISEVRKYFESKRNIW
ncbi:bifunctional folylpolyglutamate synthase/dihydrofolate synthase [Halobacillus locisalis]|uniref:tetrahydrofolate synthase n=2 Tax=Halobacillus locisalis TaxID=220753 RepID=A0A838CNE3_9BACI|nr:bifunctional folylpolyglutamate synthase/dihydrofolate synthase [Halobacillus locisalis]